MKPDIKEIVRIMKKIFLLFYLLIPFSAFSQEDLMKLVSDSNEVFVRTATFKARRIINGHSVETVG